jgi:putative NADPH-quinone reductase
VTFAMHWPTPMPTRRSRPVTASPALRLLTSTFRCCAHEEFDSGTLPAALKPAADAIVGADHIVLVFPLWLGTVPALAKAFLEQVMRPGVTFAYEKYGAKKLLAGRSARIVVTLGMPAWLISDILFRPRHSWAAPQRIQVCRILAGPNNDVRLGRERV